IMSKREAPWRTTLGTSKLGIGVLLRRLMILGLRLTCLIMSLVPLLLRTISVIVFRFCTGLAPQSQEEGA
ncbi:coat protein, partial [Corchorus capsularis]